MIIRSAFWLTIGFLLVAPHGTDFGAAASQVKDQAITAGSTAVAQIIADQVLGGPAIHAVATRLTASVPTVVPPMQDSPTATFVFPRPRPAALG